MTYFKLLNSMSVATLSRIMKALNDLIEEQGVTCIPQIKVYNVLDVRLTFFPERTLDGYQALAQELGHRCGSLPINALRIMEEED